MNNKIKMGLAFMALFFVLSPQAKKVNLVDINNGMFSDDFLKMTKDITLKASKDNTTLNSRFFRVGSCLISSENSSIKKNKLYYLGTVSGSLQPEGWIIEMRGVTQNIIPLTNWIAGVSRISLRCLLPDTVEKSRKDLTTEDIEKASDGLIVFNRTNSFR